MSKNPEKLRMILKFDTGADGFLKMIRVLAVTAGVVLILGIYFLLCVYKTIIPTSS